jgi:nitrite reductase (cytochrome c-552)
MPYMRQDGQKYTSHWMTNPLKHYDSACSKCHDESYETMLHRAQTINNNTFKLLRTAGETTARAHKTIQAAKAAGATDEQLAESRLLIREAQWYWDWVSAESSMGFHNPDKCMKSLGLSIDAAHRAIESALAATKGTYTLEPLPTQPFTTTKFDAPTPAPSPAQ